MAKGHGLFIGWSYESGQADTRLRASEYSVCGLHLTAAHVVQLNSFQEGNDHPCK